MQVWLTVRITADMIGCSFKLYASFLRVSLSALKRLNSQCAYVYTLHVPLGRDSMTNAFSW